MLKIFRRIRKKLLSENKFSKYMLYAIGEIVLVVIGILIALQINNWNGEKKLKARETILLKELKLNLETNITNLEKDIKTQTKSMYYLDYVLDHANNKRPNNDSIAKFLGLGSYVPDVVLTASAFETLKSSGLELVHTDSLRLEIVNLYEVADPLLMQNTRRLEDQLWPAVVVPLLQKHFKSENGFWVVNDYEAWINDTVFFNMLSFRRALRVLSTETKTAAAKQTTDVIRLIENELKNRNVN